VKFTLAEQSDVSVTILDAGGRSLRVLEMRPLAAGPQSVGWDGLDLAGRKAPSGVYFARVAAGSWRTTLRLVLVR